MEISEHCECSERAYFLTVVVMDRYLMRTSLVEGSERIMELGRACLLVATKFADEYGAPTRKLAKFTHGKFN